MRNYYIEGNDYDEEWSSDRREGRKHLEKYPDFLGEPIYLDPRWLTADPQQTAEIQQKIDKLIYSKMCGFFALFGIDPRKPGAWKQLAHAFFFQLPGLQITVEPPAKKKGRGAPKKYNDVECARMVLKVGNALKKMAAEGEKPSILAALERELAKDDTLEGLALKRDGKTKMDAPSLKSRYDELKRIWINQPANKELLKDPRNTPESLAGNFLKFSASITPGRRKL